MFSSGPNYNKLKTNLRLCSNRLKLLEKKKTETNQKARKEIAGKWDSNDDLRFVSEQKPSPLICTRFPVDQQAGSSKDPRRINNSGRRKRDLRFWSMTHSLTKLPIDLSVSGGSNGDSGDVLRLVIGSLWAGHSAERAWRWHRRGCFVDYCEFFVQRSVHLENFLLSSQWVAPRLQADVAELKVVSDMLQSKYGRPYADACRASVPPSNVSEKLQHKMSIQAPPKLLVEKYLIEIAKIFNIDYEPDQSIMQSGVRPDGFLIDLKDSNNLDGNIPAPPGPGFAAFPQPPPLPIVPNSPSNGPFTYPQLPHTNYPAPSNNAPFNYPAPTNNPPFNYPAPSNNPPFNYPGPPNFNYNNNNNNSGGGGGGMSDPHLFDAPSAPSHYSYNYNIPPNPAQSEKKDLNVNLLDVSKCSDFVTNLSSNFRFNCTNPSLAWSGWQKERRYATAVLFY